MKSAGSNSKPMSAPLGEFRALQLQGFLPGFWVLTVGGWTVGGFTGEQRKKKVKTAFAHSDSREKILDVLILKEMGVMTLHMKNLCIGL